MWGKQNVNRVPLCRSGGGMGKTDAGFANREITAINARPPEQMRKKCASTGWGKNAEGAMKDENNG